MATYKALLTTAGAAKIAAATAGGTQVKITRMAVGDGGGKLPTPDPKQAKLVNEVYRANLNRLSIDAKNSNYLVAEQVIQPDVGGFWMREMGLYDADGVLIAVSNMAESYKPQLAEGSGRLQTLRMVLIVSEIESVALSIDGSTVMATKDYVDDKLAEHEKSRNHPDGTTVAKGFVQLSSSVSSDSEVLAATPKAVKAANNNANGRLPSGGTAVAANKLATARKIAGVAFDGTADISIPPANVGALPAGGTAVAANKLATARKIAGVAFDGTADISIPPANVGALPSGGTAVAANKLATARKIAGVAFDGTSDINLGAGNVDAVPTTGGEVSYLKNATFYGTSPDSWEGAGGFASQYTTPSAPFFIPLGYRAPAGVSNYLPIIKGLVQTATHGYGTAVSFGAVTSGTAKFAQAVIHVIGDNGVSREWFFDPTDGAFSAPGGNIVAGQGLYESGGAVRAYSSNYKPTPEAINAIQRDMCDIAGFAAGNVNDPYMRRSATYEIVRIARRDWVENNFATTTLLSNTDSAARNWANNDLRNDIYAYGNNRYVYDVQRGSQALENAGWTAQQVWEAPTGCFMTGLNIRTDLGDCRMMGKYYRALMIRSASGSWRQVGN
ncbi:phage tail protein [Rahnella inusitata]|uniref:phage tail protein n=1 Tax=Rahnella inusitata TaxID=58169 RepID=UPI0039AFBE8A